MATHKIKPFEQFLKESTDDKILKIKLTGEAYREKGGFQADCVINCVNDENDGEDCTIYWDLIEYDDDSEIDDEDACDWGNPDGVKLSGRWITDKFKGVNQYKGYKVQYLDKKGKKL